MLTFQKRATTAKRSLTPLMSAVPFGTVPAASVQEELKGPVLIQPSPLISRFKELRERFGKASIQMIAILLLILTLK